MIYGLPGMDDGKFNQIVTANQMSINVVDQETLKAILGGQFGRLPGVGEKCEGVCDRGARCHRGICQCPEAHSENNGECIQAGNDAQFQVSFWSLRFTFRTEDLGPRLEI